MELTLRDLRKQAKMTARQVADKLGIGVHAIYKYETGIRGVDILTSYTLAKIYDVTLDEFFEAYMNTRSLHNQ